MLRLFLLWLLSFSCFLAAGEIEFRILGTTDTHGQTFPAEPCWEQLSCLIRQKKAEHPDAVLVDCGDTFQGSYAAFATKGSVFAGLLVKLGYDIFVPGNHDFEFGGKPLLKNLQLLQKKCAVLAANLEPFDGSPVRVCHIRHRGKIKIGFIGLSETQVPYRVPAPALAPFRFCDEKKSLARAVGLLKAQNVNAIVLLRHNGLYSRTGPLAELIRPYPEIKLVMGGHSHELNAGSKVGHALYVQPGCRTNALAEAVLVFDRESGRFLQCRSRLYPVSAGDAKDPEITAFLRKNAISLPYRKTRFPIPQTGRIPSRLALEAMLHATQADAAMLRTAKEEKPLGPEAGIFQLYSRFPYANRILLVELTRSEFNTLLSEQKKLDKTDRFQRTAVLDRSRPGAAAVKAALPDYLAAGGGRSGNAGVLKGVRVLNPDPPFLLDAVTALLTSTAEKGPAPGRNKAE